jgi:tetratricopeptide (TPR) repeat protein
MNYSELISEYNKILSFISEKRIADAFGLLDKLAEKCTNIDFKDRLNENLETYRNILKYSFELSDDPEKEKVYNRLIKSLVELNDEIKEDIIRRNKLLSYYQLYERTAFKGAESEQEIKKWIDQISLEKEVEKFLDKETNIQVEKEKLDASNEISHKLFTYFWLSDKLQENQVQLIKKAGLNPFLSWYYKSLIVSSVTLSALRHFDVEKIKILFEFYQRKEPQVWQRALIGILIIMFIYDSRIRLYPEIGQRIKIFQTDKKWNKTIELIVIQFLRSRETEKISAKIRNEIMPELWKARTHLQEKLNLEELLSEKSLEDKNPEWETVFEDSPDLYNKIEEFSNLQMEGSDVFMSAFAMLKGFDFFNRPGNWFLPFYKENLAFKDIFDDSHEGFDPSEFMDGLERSRFLCNSDKYSFCLNVKHLPAAQKSMMTQFFKMELEAMNEMSDEGELANIDMADRSIIIQYIQDLYRFYRLHPLKRELDDIFELPLDFHNTGFFNLIVDDPAITRNIAEFYFEKDHFQEALDIFLGLQRIDKSYELLEKAAYCYQQLGKFKEALDFYKKAELQSKPRSWLLNKIAYCYRRLGDYDSAISYYTESEKIDPENLYIQTSLGQVNVDKHDFETALKYFYKVEYLAPDNIKVHRPIAWCSFVLGKPQVAQKYFTKVIEKEANQYDYMNLGHVYWCMGNKKLAIENYLLSIKKSGNDFDWFSGIMAGDSKHLIDYKISPFDIPLMLDYLKINQLK